MGLQQIQSIIHLASCGSIRQTAERMHLSAAAVHKQLKALQTELGTPLYHRKAGRLVLTQEARTLLPYWTNALGQYTAGLAALSESKGLRRGMLRIGAGPTMASDILPPLLQSYCRRHPGIDISVETGNTGWVLELLTRGAIDVGFLAEPPLDVEKQLAVRATWDFEIVLAAGTNMRRRRCSFSELKGNSFILFQPGSRIEEAIDRYFQRIGFVPRATMRLDNAQAIKALIRSGLGLSMLPFWTVAADSQQQAIRIIRQEEPPLLSTIVLVTPKDTYCAPSVQAFIREAKLLDAPMLTRVNRHSRRRTAG